MRPRRRGWHERCRRGPRAARSPSSSPRSPPRPAARSPADRRSRAPFTTLPGIGAVTFPRAPPRAAAGFRRSRPARTQPRRDRQAVDEHVDASRSWPGVTTTAAPPLSGNRSDQRWPPSAAASTTRSTSVERRHERLAAVLERHDTDPRRRLRSRPRMPRTPSASQPARRASTALTRRLRRLRPGAVQVHHAAAMAAASSADRRGVANGWPLRVASVRLRNVVSTSPS